MRNAFNSVLSELWENKTDSSEWVPNGGRVAIYVTRDSFLAKVTCGLAEAGVIQGWVGYGNGNSKDRCDPKGVSYSKPSLWTTPEHTTESSWRTLNIEGTLRRFAFKKDRRDRHFTFFIIWSYLALYHSCSRYDLVFVCERKSISSPKLRHKCQKAEMNGWLLQIHRTVTGI